MNLVNGYFDYNATAPARPEVVDAIASALRETAGNPSSMHVGGRRARALIDQARDRSAALVGVHPNEVYFTSGATESNNLAMRGFARLHPAARAKDLDRRERQRLARATLTVSRRAYELKGVTVTPKLMASLKRAGQRYGQYRHWVFARHDEPCRRCTTGVERQSLAGRAVFVCPACQPKPCRSKNIEVADKTGTPDT